MATHIAGPSASSPPSSTTSTAITAPHPILVDTNFRQGLALDISVLQALIARHRCSHGRTIYFRRMGMVLKCLVVANSNQYPVLDGLSRLQSLQNDVNKFHQDTIKEEEKQQLERQRRRKQQQNHRSSRKQSFSDTDEQWSLYPTTASTTNIMLGGNDGSNPSTNNTNNNVSITDRLVDEMKYLMRLWMEKIPEILSRIHHASRALFVEVGRGFFLPFCSVALSALARIRSMLMIIGRLGLTQLVQGIQSKMILIRMTITTTKAESTTTRSSRRLVEPIVSDEEYTKVISVFIDDEQHNNETSSHRSIASNQGLRTATATPTWQNGGTYDMEESLLISLGFQPKSNKNKTTDGVSQRIRDPNGNNDQMFTVEDEDKAVQSIKIITSNMSSDQDGQQQHQQHNDSSSLQNSLEEQEDGSIDLGESIDYISTVTTTDGDTMKKTGRISSTTTTKTTTSASLSCYTGAIDQNMALVNNFQSKKKGTMTVAPSLTKGSESKEDRLHKTSRKAQTSALRVSTPSKERAKKEKKNTKKRKANFFDDLFD
jgi:hypothetical protein